MHHLNPGRAALLVLLIALVAASGCKKEPEAVVKGETSAKSKQVIVDVTGLT